MKYTTIFFCLISFVILGATSCNRISMKDVMSPSDLMIQELRQGKTKSFWDTTSKSHKEWYQNLAYQTKNSDASDKKPYACKKMLQNSSCIDIEQLNDRMLFDIFYKKLAGIGAFEQDLGHPIVYQMSRDTLFEISVKEDGKLERTNAYVQENKSWKLTQYGLRENVMFIIAIDYSNQDASKQKDYFCK